ncbi:MAG: HNH endonuclease, partial [Mycobacteriaceae bacterium]
YISPTGHRYHSRTAGYLDLLGLYPEDITHPDGRRQRRRTRAQNKTANIRAERRRQQTHHNLTKLSHNRTRRGEPPPDDDEPCPF